jgi:hypothetical protein
MPRLILNETYFGKQPDLVQVEGYFDTIKKQMSIGKNPNSLPEKTKIEKILGNKFGFEEVVLIFLPEENVMNAYTVPFFTEKKFDELNFALERSDNGLRFKNPKNKTLYVYLYNYLLRRYDVESIMSVLLHEIGHNFFLIDEQIKDNKIKNAIGWIIYIYNFLVECLKCNQDVTFECFKALLDVSLYVKSPQKYQYNLATENGRLIKDKAQSDAYVDSKKKHLFRKAFRIASQIIKLPFKIAWTGIKILLKPLMLGNSKSILKTNVKRTQDYNAERFSDNFAMMYGYSVGVATTFSGDNSKFVRSREWDFKVPIVRLFNYIDEMYSECVYGFSDEHPASIKRVMDAKAKVEYEMKNTTLSKAHRQELEDQLEKINNIITNIPSYQKFINNSFKKLIDEKDEIGSSKYSQTDIFDADKKVINNYIKEDTYLIEDISDDDKEYLQENNYSFAETNHDTINENHRLINNLIMTNEEKLATLTEDQIVNLLVISNRFYPSTRQILHR